MNDIIARTRVAAANAAFEAVLSPSKVAGIAALTLGVVLLFGIGFAYPEMVHTVAHDGRHAFAMPCH